MKIAAIIAEYNPFHNGHQYQITETRKNTGADYIVAVMSGDFLQRGGPALCNKYIRTHMALSGGVTLFIRRTIPHGFLWRNGAKNRNTSSFLIIMKRVCKH